MREKSFLVLMHYPCVDRTGKVITSAITALDMHDFARLAKTYGLGGVYVQTNLPQQVELIQRLLGYWVDGSGAQYNAHRKEAFEGLTFKDSLDAVIEEVASKFGEKPIVAMTSARDVGLEQHDYESAREKANELGRPLLVLFGTASGLAPEVFEKCDWVLEPIGSPSGYNHLSVRSAASIIVDRLFG